MFLKSKIAALNGFRLYYVLFTWRQRTDCRAAVLLLLNDSEGGRAAAFWTSSFQTNNYASLYCPEDSIMILCHHWPLMPCFLLFESYCDSALPSRTSQLSSTSYDYDDNKCALIHLSPSSVSEEIRNKMSVWTSLAKSFQGKGAGGAAGGGEARGAGD